MVLICRFLVATCLLGTALSTLRIYPHQLAYFNEVAGGPENGWKHLLHSNFDWGQDFLFVREWMRDNEVLADEVRVTSYSMLQSRGMCVIAQSGAAIAPEGAVRYSVVSPNILFGPSRSTAKQLLGRSSQRIGYTLWLFAEHPQ